MRNEVALADDIKTLWVPGSPRPQSRPRVGMHRNIYQPDSGYQAEVAATWLEKFGKCPIPKGTPVEVTLTFHFGKDPGLKVQVVPLDQNMGWRDTRPDIDRLTAAVLDALGGHTLSKGNIGGLAWEDDGQVALLVASKQKE